MSDYFNACDVLPYVKDLNLGFQGILANTRQYDAPDGKWADMQTAIDHYQETWWLEQMCIRDRAFNVHTLKRNQVVSALARAGFCLAEGAPYEGLEHWVEQAVMRDLVVARAPLA